MPPLVKQLIFILAVAVVVWAGYWALRHWAALPHKAFALYAIALGDVGNLIDRVFRDGHVVGYLIVNVGALHTGVFNIADIAITAGAMVLAWDLFAKADGKPA
ncbi:prolipoprotein signal peptidase (Signal peptidase II.) [Pseudomonas sp. M47T1]|uniref:signal peptidase II n=1 Tax=unclassified Pseudomonas TaxID=196821 RepID=UPI0002608056|nr:prolipoprotein signal peptidase (Signal peptidase II.) [Pseudomonas sp. M47T1]